MVTNWMLDQDLSEDSGVVKGAKVLSALLEGGEAGFQGYNKGRLYRELQDDAQGDSPIRPAATLPRAREGLPSIDWTQGDLLPNAQKYFKRAQLRALTGDKEGAKIERAEAEKASIDSREGRKLNQKLLVDNRELKKATQENKRVFDSLKQIDANIAKKKGKMGGSFWDRLATTIKQNPDGFDFNQLGKVFSSAEENAYIKNLAALAKGAKNTFGSRVTNFDLQQYMQQFPQLWQSPEARAALIDSLIAVNELNSLHADLIQRGLAETGMNANPAVFDAKIEAALAPYIEEANAKIAKIYDTMSFPEQSPPPDSEGIKDLKYVDGAWYGKKDGKTVKYEP